MRRLVSRALVIVGILGVVFGARCAWIRYAAIDLPVWDEWLDAPPYGLPNANGLLAAHNEHRVLSERLTVMALHLSSGYWDVRGGLIVSAFLRALEMALLCAALWPITARGGRVGLVAVLVAIGALPLSPFNLLAGLQMAFSYAEIFSFVALFVLFGSATLPRETLAVACLYGTFAYFSMATGLVAPVAAVFVMALQAGLIERDRRMRLLAIVAMVGLATLGYIDTPRVAIFHATGIRGIATTLRAAWSFPWPSWWALAVLAQAPIALFLRDLVRRREPGRDWFLAACGLWSLVLAAATAVGRGAEGVTEQHLEALALAGLWNYVALTRLCEKRSSARFLPGLWAGLLVLFLGLHVWWQAWPTLQTAHERAPSVAAAFARRLRTGDWSEPIAVVTQAMERRDYRFVADPLGRYTLPVHVMKELAAGDRSWQHLLPPSLTGQGTKAPVARALAAVQALWPAWLVLGALAMARGAWAERRP